MRFASASIIGPIFVAFCCCSSSGAAPASAEIADASQSDVSEPDSNAVEDAIAEADIVDRDVEPTDVFVDSHQECDNHAPIKLETQFYQGLPMAVFVPVVYEQAPSLMHFDTAAGFSILYLPAGAPWTTSAGKATIGCEQRSMDGWGVVDPEFGTTVPVVGTLGGDWLLESATTLDVGSGMIWRDTSMPAGLTEDVTHQVVNDTVVVTVQVEGVDRLLVVDTGAAYTVLNGEGGKPGDTQANFLDWNGDEVEAYLGSAEVSIGGEYGTVPVLRTPSFVGVEYAAQSTGLDITGLLGLSSIDVMHVDPNVSRVRIRPKFQDGTGSH